MTALSFARDHAAIIAIVAIIIAVLLFAEWRRFRRDQRSIATVYERLFPYSAADAGVPGLARDDRQRGVHSNHNCRSNP